MHFQYLNCKQNASNLRLDGYLYYVMCPFYRTFFHTVCLLSNTNDAKVQKCLTKKYIGQYKDKVHVAYPWINLRDFGERTARII